MTGGYLTLRFEWFNGRKLFVKFVKFQFARVLLPSAYVGSNRISLQDFARCCDPGCDRGASAGAEAEEGAAARNEVIPVSVAGVTLSARWTRQKLYMNEFALFSIS